MGFLNINRRLFDDWHLCAVSKRQGLVVLQIWMFWSKIEEVPRDIQVENSGKDTANSGKTDFNYWSMKKYQKRTEVGVQKSKCSFLACHFQCKFSMETTRVSVNVKLDNNVLKFVKRLIDWKVTVTGRVTECHLTFSRKQTWMVDT